MSNRTCAACIALFAWVALASAAHAQSFGDRLGRPQRTPPPAAPAWPGDSPEARGPSEVQAPQPNYRASGRGLPPDLVLTRDGGMIRGTILRSQPGQFVDVQLPTGELERVAWSDVRFAGRAEEAPSDEPVARDAPRSSSGSLPIRFVANGRITLHRVSASATMQASQGWVTVHGRSDLYEPQCTV
jgi:hypothetical protein